MKQRQDNFVDSNAFLESKSENLKKRKRDKETKSFKNNLKAGERATSKNDKKKYIQKLREADLIDYDYEDYEEDNFS